MSQWLWGLRHQVKFRSLLADFIGDNPAFSFLADSFSLTTETLPLAEGLTSEDPRKKLMWFPRGGDNYSVDAANPGFGGTNFTHGSGPVMRMVIALKDGKVWGQNIVPGGQSGLLDSEHHHDQVGLWLANETVPFRFHPQDVVDGALSMELLEP
jgi:penicillin amidase